MSLRAAAPSLPKTQSKNSKLRPPGPRQWYPLQNLRRIRHDALNFLAEVKGYGDLASFKLGPIDVFFINNPDLIAKILVADHQYFNKGYALQRSKRMLGEGLLTSEGEFHMRQRRLAQPAFHAQRVAAYDKDMIEAAQRVTGRWQDGQMVDVSDDMKRLALIIAGKTLFGADVEGEAADVGEALTTAIELFNTFGVPFERFLEKLPLPAVLRFKRAKAQLDKVVYKMIEQRRRDPKPGRDLMSLLLTARDTLGDGGGMTDVQLRDEAMTIFLAGHETTANAMSWSWYLLSQNPDAREKLEAEARSLRDASGNLRAPTASDLPNLQFTEHVFAESMRMYPPAWALARRAIKDYEIEGYKLRTGSVAMMSQWVMHHDERFYPEPFKFKPERWIPVERAKRPKFSYFPFGGGPRVCIGEAFAWMEGVLLLATIAQRWRLELIPGTKVEPQTTITLRIKGGLKMRAQRIN